MIPSSVKDGVFLLKGDRILYINSVGKLLLNSEVQKFNFRKFNFFRDAFTGLSLKSLFDTIKAPQKRNQNFNAEKETKVIEALYQAHESRVPFELQVEFENRRAQYLIQSFSLLKEDKENSLISQFFHWFEGDSLILIQDISLLLEVEEAKNHFLGTLSHEIKTPVTSLTMAIHLLKRNLKEIPDEPNKKLILTCVEDIDRLRILLDKLLNFSQLSKNSLTGELLLQKNDLLKLMKQLVQSFQFKAGEKEISLEFKTSYLEKNLFANIDITKISWAISNLLSNAVKFTPKGGRILVLLKVEKDWIQIEVIDSGPGIVDTQINRVFDKFSSIYDLRTASSGATGVGLSIAREMIAAHGGKIWVSNQRGGGACFRMTLPYSPHLRKDFTK